MNQLRDRFHTKFPCRPHTYQPHSEVAAQREGGPKRRCRQTSQPSKPPSSTGCHVPPAYGASRERRERKAGSPRLCSLKDCSLDNHYRDAIPRRGPLRRRHRQCLERQVRRTWFADTIYQDCTGGASCGSELRRTGGASSSSLSAQTGVGTREEAASRRGALAIAPQQSVRAYPNGRSGSAASLAPYWEVAHYFGIGFPAEVL